MGEILKGAMLVELSPVRLELADLRIEGGRIVERAARIDPGPGDRVTDLSGRLLMPGLVVAHTHLYCSLALGMPPPAHEPKSFREILDQVWWKLDRALDPTTVILSASAGAAEALLHGITTIVDLHSSPSFIEGSLAAVHRGVSAVGARSVLSYEVTDRNGKEAAKAALRESESFLKNGQNARCRSLVGGHSSFTLDNDTLEAMVGIAREHQVGLHLHVAESPEDDRDAR
jgi:cytosine/adenosine deaminase-related metal-dependent hydrolase